ncbi:hypothetical protein KHA93_09275 [Bacillus sp. FJAT-49732]|uniref:Lipoprotein n=1 Tax=Lederbergia citrisecunda TaxID=2833583 RepID=A0A942YKQ0_9BACI|nr:hypothetical protein [Lederbergia citrisecunda]MBS4199847.1 hypothetical protein [Lederbergia citrisecunda]
MKKIFIMLLSVLVVLVGCASKPKETINEEVPAVQDEGTDKIEPEVSDEESKVATQIELSVVEEAITYAGMGEDDKLESVYIENGDIEIVIELAPNDLLDPKDLAVTSYSQASDELLEHEGWKTLTIKYVEIGTISMNRSEKETNDLGMDYFPTRVITERLK